MVELETLQNLSTRLTDVRNLLEISVYQMGCVTNGNGKALTPFEIGVLAFNIVNDTLLDLDLMQEEIKDEYFYFEQDDEKLLGGDLDE